MSTITGRTCAPRPRLARRVAPRALGARAAPSRARDEDDTARHLRDGTARATAFAAAPRARADRAKPLTVVSGYGGVCGRGPGGRHHSRPRPVAFLPYLVPLPDGLRYRDFPRAVPPGHLPPPAPPTPRVHVPHPLRRHDSFFAIYMGIAENRTLSRFVRFNGMQAIILDVCLVLPGMIEHVLSPGRPAASRSTCTGCA